MCTAQCLLDQAIDRNETLKHQNEVLRRRVLELEKELNITCDELIRALGFMAGNGIEVTVKMEAV